MAPMNTSRTAIPTPASHRSQQTSRPTSPGSIYREMAWSYKAAMSAAGTDRSGRYRGDAPVHPLEAAAILDPSRLQHVTGVLPRNLARLKGVPLSRKELAQLQWVQRLPDVYPTKRPKGLF
ncbi:hypothetical protein GGS23DRAFT_595670 [Durotheca rogersii]|uniref:uncharacterized protein n=1 Tax=Durotheca rogersii TaxID=419775 RepID=UPI00221E47F3|nr:uncharacterized protein GGS23DRAFT_595670 [Durotheca rogersii]KAI5864018.1 hypothetical protein GGS23DRAFT_595670 [Durotheca rogersii]